MRRSTTTLITILVLAAVARAETPAELIQRVGKSPVSMKDKIALAEAYLQECRLDESLAAWRAVLKADGKIHFEKVDELLDQMRRGGVQNVLLLTQQKVNR